MFKENLQKVCDAVGGATAALVMGFDGIAVDTHIKLTGHDVNTVGMEFSYVLAQVRKATEALEIGDLQEIVVRSEQLTFVVRVLNREYFVAIVLSPDGNLGKARYALRMAAPALTAEL